MQRILRTAANLGVMLLSLLVTFVLCEAVLRFTRFHSYALPVFGFYPRYYYKPDPVKGYDIEENFPKTKAYVYSESEYDLWSNEIGCFDRPYEGEKAPILLVGDSFTHSFAPFEDKWGTQMEERLGVRVLKCGVNGYGTKQALLKAQEVVQRTRTHPSLIVLGYFLNDLRDDWLFPFYGVKDGYLVSRRDIKRIRSGEILEFDRVLDAAPPSDVSTRAQRSRWQAWWGSESIILKLFGLALQKMPYPPAVEEFLKEKRLITENTNAIGLYDYPWMERAWPPHLENLREFKAYADSIGAKFLVVLIPAKEQVLPFRHDYSFAENPDFERPNRIVSQFLRQQGISFVDLLPLFKERSSQGKKQGEAGKENFYWKQDGHWNVAGNRLAGSFVSEFLLKEKMLDDSTPVADSAEYPSIPRGVRTGKGSFP